MSNANKIQVLIAEIRKQVFDADKAFESALQERDNLLATPILKGEVKLNIAQAVDNSAERFKKTLTAIVAGRARKRDAIGVRRNPDVVRSQGNYSELNIDAINFFIGDIIKGKVNGFIDEMEYFGVDDGLSESDFAEQLKEVEIKIDDLKSSRDQLRQELNSVLN